MLLSTSKFLVAAMLCGTLTACSDDDFEDRSFSDYEDDIEELENEIVGLDYTDPATLPTTGSAQYNGVMGLAVGGGESPAEVLAGDLELNASFAQSAVTGSVTDIVDGNNDEYGGSLDIDDDYFNRNTDPDDEFTYGASLTGSVTDPDGDEWDIDAIMDGDFFGTNWSHTAGEVVGDACTTPLECVDLDGIYAAER